MSENINSVCQFFRMQLFSLGIEMKVVQNVIRMSDIHFVCMSICQHVNTSIFQYVRIQLFRLVINMKFQSENFYRQLKSPLLFQERPLDTNRHIDDSCSCQRIFIISDVQQPKSDIEGPRFPFPRIHTLETMRRCQHMP